MLKRFLEGFKKVLKGKEGYTLVEIAAVVAVTATMAAVVVPVALDKINESKLSSARQDCQQIAAAIASFYKDTGIWPAKTDATEQHYHVLQSGDTVGTGNPAESNDWDLTTATTDLMEYHLVKDEHEYITDKYNWKGPYIESVAGKTDPWGHNYLVNVEAMYTPTSGTGGTKKYGWIISAGPNGNLDTDVDDNTLSGDDIGLYIYAAETGN